MTGRPPHLLLADDGSPAAAEAIATAARLMPGAPATVVTVWEPWTDFERAALARVALPDSIIVPAVRERQAELERAARRLAEAGRDRAVAAGLDAEPHVQEARRPSHGICAAARELRPDVIVCGASGRGGVSRAVLGTTTGQLLQDAPVPVLVVPRQDEPANGPLLIGFDDSEQAAEAIRTAGRLFAGRRTLIAHEWFSPTEDTYPGRALLGTPVDEVHDVAQSLSDIFAAEAAELIQRGVVLAREAGLDAEPLEVRSTRGAWRGLEAAAREHDAAAIVVGSRGRGAVASTVLGSTSSGLAHNAIVPILIVRRVSEHVRDDEHG